MNSWYKVGLNNETGLGQKLSKSDSKYLSWIQTQPVILNTKENYPKPNTKVHICLSMLNTNITEALNRTGGMVFQLPFPPKGTYLNDIQMALYSGGWGVCKAFCRCMRKHEGGMALVQARLSLHISQEEKGQAGMKVLGPQCLQTILLSADT